MWLKCEAGARTSRPSGRALRRPDDVRALMSASGDRPHSVSRLASRGGRGTCTGGACREAVVGVTGVSSIRDEVSQVATTARGRVANCQRNFPQARSEWRTPESALRHRRAGHGGGLGVAMGMCAFGPLMRVWKTGPEIRLGEPEGVWRRVEGCGRGPVGMAPRPLALRWRLRHCPRQTGSTGWFERLSPAALRVFHAGTADSAVLSRGNAPRPPSPAPERAGHSKWAERWWPTVDMWVREVEE
jgi:hypothetical protein